MTRNAEMTKMIRKYLTTSVKSQFDMDIDLEKEYTLTENIVSKKPIIAPTFTQKILGKPALKLFLTSLITEINYEKCSWEFIRSKLKSIQGSDSQHIPLT